MNIKVVTYEMPERNYPHITISVSTLFSDEYIDSFKEDLSCDGLELEINIYDKNQMYASMEWAIPTAISVYIFKPYFDGILKEIGKEHYGILKTWLKNKVDDLKPIKMTAIVSAKSKEKIDRTNTQSKTFSIESIIENDLRIKFLFDDNLNIEEWRNGIDKALFLLENHFNGTSDKIINEIKNKNLRHQIFGVINPISFEWEFFDFSKNRIQRLNIDDVKKNVNIGQ